MKYKIFSLFLMFIRLTVVAENRENILVLNFAKVAATNVFVIHPDSGFILLKNNLFFIGLIIMLLLLASLVIVLNFWAKGRKKNLQKEKEFVAAIEEKTEYLGIALEKLEQANKLKNVFLSNISHEIRTPLNGILGFSYLLGNTDDKQTRVTYAETIRVCGTRLLNTVNDMLEISLIECRQVKVNKDVVPVKQLISSLVSAYNNACPKRIIFFIPRERPADIPPLITTDKGKVQRILTNLISNAIKFSENKPIEIGYNIKNDYLEFYVKDNGIGIDPQFHDLIFERFYQVDQSPSRIYNGAGLGLVIAKAYVELLGGKMWLESALEKGSTFYFSLPYNKYINAENLIHQKYAEIQSDKDHVLLDSEGLLFTDTYGTLNLDSIVGKKDGVFVWPDTFMSLDKIINN